MASSTGAAASDWTPGTADQDLSAHTFRAVKKTATGVDFCLAGERAIGVLQNKPKITEGCTVRGGGTSKVVVDGSVTPGNIASGDKLKSDAVGRGVRTVTDGDEVFGIALEPSTATGDIIEALMVNRQA
jgi:hypothetical protein